MCNETSSEPRTYVPPELYDSDFFDDLMNALALALEKHWPSRDELRDSVAYLLIELMNFRLESQFAMSFGSQTLEVFVDGPSPYIELAEFIDQHRRQP